MKKCSQCKIEKEEVEFYKRSSCHGGYDTKCKSCIHIRNKEYYNKHPELAQAQAKKWKETHPYANRNNARRYSKEHPIELLLSTYKCRAKRCGFTWDISIEEHFEELVKEDCYLCGAKAEEDKKRGINGLDRIDNNLGYQVGNVKACCRHCNTAKNTMSLKEYKKWLLRTYTHINKNE